MHACTGMFFGPARLSSNFRTRTASIVCFLSTFRKPGVTARCRHFISRYIYFFEVSGGMDTQHRQSLPTLHAAFPSGTPLVGIGSIIAHDDAGREEEKGNLVFSCLAADFRSGYGSSISSCCFFDFFVWDFPSAFLSEPFSDCGLLVEFRRFKLDVETGTQLRRWGGLATSAISTNNQSLICV